MSDTDIERLDYAMQRGWLFTCYSMPSPGEPFTLHITPPEYHRARSWSATFRIISLSEDVQVAIPHWFEEELKHRK